MSSKFKYDLSSLDRRAVNIKIIQLRSSPDHVKNANVAMLVTHAHDIFQPLQNKW